MSAGSDMKLIGAYEPKANIARVDSWASTLGVSRSEFMRQALRVYIGTLESKQKTT